MEKDAKIYVAGHTGLVGSALLRKLNAEGYTKLITRNHAELDLGRQSNTEAFLKKEKPDYVILAAAKVGGIWANKTYPAEFIYSNLAIQTNVIHAAWKTGVKRLLFLGSSCIYPKECSQPMKEEHLLTGPLEATNEPYGTSFIAVMPTNLYGPNDNFDLETSHVLPALVRKFHLAKLAVQGDWEGIKRDESHFGAIPDDVRFALGLQPPASNLQRHSPKVVLWGSGRPRREFLHVDDLANACVFIMKLEEEAFRSLLTLYRSPLINIGWGKDISIKELALIIKEIVGFKGDLEFDSSKPDGTPRKLLDSSILGTLGWSPKVSLREGIKRTYEWCLQK
jgi:GDP-L-fucose synthase